MNEAIKLAIEKGEWKGTGARFNFYDKQMGSCGWYLADNYAEWENEEVIVLDPLFWQALGKALGWGEDTQATWFGIYSLPTEWQAHAHQYFDLVLTGGDTEKFWKDLINNV